MIQIDSTASHFIYLLNFKVWRVMPSKRRIENVEKKKELYFSSFSPRGKNNSINILNKHVSAPVRLFIAKLTYCVYARCVRNVI